MQINLIPPTRASDKCLVLIGGVGDPAEIFDPLIKMLTNKLPNHAICTFTFSQKSDKIGLLELQSQELIEVLSQLIHHQDFKTIDLWCTSMGSYATVKALINQDYSSYISHVIFFDPADYYLDDQAMDVDQENTWSGYQDYKPAKPTVSSLLANVRANILIDVIHLTVRNHGMSGYLESDYNRRGIDNTLGFPRLNTEMVKSFYAHVPPKNRDKYLEINHLPHAIFRDGVVGRNLQTIVDNLVVTLA